MNKYRERKNWAGKSIFDRRFRPFNKGQAAAELAIFGTIILITFSMLLMYGQRLEVQQQVKMEAFRRALQKAYDRNSSVTYTLKKDTRAVNLFGGFGQGQPLTASATANVMWQKGVGGQQGDKEQESFSFYQINNDIIGDQEKGLPRYPKKSVDFTGGEHTVMVPAAVWGEEQVRTEEFSSEETKAENPQAGINNSAVSTLRDTVTTKLRTRMDTSVDRNLWDKETPLPEYYYDNPDEGPTQYAYEGTTYTIKTFPLVIQGAYMGENNRVEYSGDNEGTTIRREKSWQTGY